MPDTLSHTAQGGLLLVAPFLSRIRKQTWLWMLGLAGGVFGALPDLIGAYGNIIRHDHWSLYMSAHSGRIAGILRYIPMYGLHLFLDSLGHGPGRRWWLLQERFWLEATLWLANLLVLVWMVRVWRRRFAG